MAALFIEKRKCRKYVPLFYYLLEILLVLEIVMFFNLEVNLFDLTLLSYLIIGFTALYRLFRMVEVYARSCPGRQYA